MMSRTEEAEAYSALEESDVSTDAIASFVIWLDA